MKKTPLRRKTPLKQKSILKPSYLKKVARLKNKSVSRAQWDLRYRATHMADDTLQRPVDKPHLLLNKNNHLKIQRHHPFGRAKEAILCYVYISEELHTWCHANSTAARELGWLQPSYEAKPYDPNWPRPWPESCEVGWPLEFQRLS